jgi:transcriptional regulator with XRE-family HTH domain
MSMCSATADVILDGKRLRQALKRRRLSQREFARLALTREATISRVIHGYPIDSATAFVILRTLERIDPVR